MESLLKTERVLASVIEAVIGACYLTFGYERDGPGRRRGLRRGDRGRRSRTPGLQVRSCRSASPSAARPSIYEVVEEEGPPHDRRFAVEARVNGRTLGRGGGRSKKDAEQERRARGAGGMG